MPADSILLGEQHDNPDHQRIEREVVLVLAANRQLAALVIEMAAQGHSTALLGPDATEEIVKSALNWDDKAWPWSAYAGPIMDAIRAGVPVVGANLPRPQMRAAMADAALDQRLDAFALKRQNQSIRDGHCELLPESQITPMTRVQIARDVAMAAVVSAEVDNAARQAAAAAPPSPQRKTVLLIAGSGHVDTALAVPRHLPAGVTSRSVLLSARQATKQPVHQVPERPGTEPAKTEGFDAVWPTESIPDKDYCAELKKSLGK